jgi:hypothetical protein
MHQSMFLMTAFVSNVSSFYVFISLCDCVCSSRFLCSELRTTLSIQSARLNSCMSFGFLLLLCCFSDGRLTKIYELLEEGNNSEEPKLKGPETVVFDNDGTMYALTEDGFLVSLTDFREEQRQNDEAAAVRTITNAIITATVTTVANLGVGRPLGGKFDADNNLYIADAHLGLTRLRDPRNTSNNNKVELVASRVFDEGKWTQLLYVNDVCVGPKSGMIYFTDSTEIAPDRIGTRTYDTMYAAKAEAIKVTKTGRLLRYDPYSDEVTVLARSLHFPNGIAVDKEENYVIFAETFALRMLRYSLETGKLEVLVDEGLTGYPDGVDCAWKSVTSVSSNKCYAVMPSAMIPILKLIMATSHPWDMILRSILLGLPKFLAPPVKRYGGIVEMDYMMSNQNNQLRIIQDPLGTDIGMLTGVTVHDNRLYLGSLKNDFIGVYQLET